MTTTHLKILPAAQTHLKKFGLGRRFFLLNEQDMYLGITVCELFHRTPSVFNLPQASGLERHKWFVHQAQAQNCKSHPMEATADLLTIYEAGVIFERLHASKRFECVIY